MRKPFVEPKPFTNNTKYQVGQLGIVKGKQYIITAIVYNTHSTVKVYAMNPSQPMKLDKFKEFQQRREAGQINIYLPGSHILTVNNPNDKRGII